VTKPGQSGPVRPARPWRPLPYPCARAPPPNAVVSIDFLPRSNFPHPSLSPRGALGFGDEIARVWIPRGEFSPSLPFLYLSLLPLPSSSPGRAPSPAPSPSPRRAPGESRPGRAPPRVAPPASPAPAEPLPASRPPGEPRPGRAPPRVAPPRRVPPRPRPSPRRPPASPTPAKPLPGRAPRARRSPSRALAARPLLRPRAPWPRPRLHPGPRPGRALGRMPRPCPGCALARPCPSPCPGSLAPRTACTFRVPPARAACSRSCDRSRVSFNPRLILL
jgi:hypothetical protein